MKESGEITILKEGHVKITNQRVIIGAKTYALSSMASVRMYEDEPRLFLPIFYMLIAALCSFLVAISNMDDYSHLLTNSLYIAIIGFLFFVLSRTTKYGVRVRSAAGEMIIWTTTDRASVERIVRVIKQAINQQESFNESQAGERAIVQH